MLLKAMNAGKSSTFLIQSPRNNDPNVHNPLLFPLFIKGDFPIRMAMPRGMF
jgi:hypothetical protein